ncbi:MAG: DUF5615 family PIN-like protein [Rhodocyclaceae bacterium]|nr:DUF5615 family PIN-like protein [Rhodocyclaceae bacterium]
MRILLDECLPRRLAGALEGHEVVTVVEAGWSGLKNGQLLTYAAMRFDVFVTADQNLQYQQNLAALPLPVVVLKASDNRYATLLPLMPKLLAVLDSLQPRTLTVVS